MTFFSTYPASGEIWQEYPSLPLDEVLQVPEKSQKAFETWRRSSFSERAKVLHNAAALLRRDLNEYARLMTREMGKPITQSKAEIEKCAWACIYFAEHAASFLKQEILPTEAHRSYVAYEPLGPVLAIMPWNFPFWQVFRFAAPALMAGNTAILKHAPNVCGCALAIEACFLEAGLPEHVFRTVICDLEGTSGMIAHPKVTAVALTGSTRAGRAVAALAGNHLKKVVLELGGSDPYVVFADADIEAAAQACVASRLLNNGQSCIAAKRWIVVEQAYQSFKQACLESMATWVMGDPLDNGVDLGPLARADLRANLHRQVEESIAAGAACLLGGTLPQGKGHFYPATLLADVTKGMPVYEEETFGPVAALIPASSEQDALRMANDTIYGLGAAIFTADRQRGEQIAREELQAGACFVNAFVRSDPRLPFGGIRQSGYGRELAAFGIREFVNIKTLYVT